MAILGLAAAFDSGLGTLGELLLVAAVLPGVVFSCIFIGAVAYGAIVLVRAGVRLLIRWYSDARDADLGA